MSADPCFEPAHRLIARLARGELAAEDLLERFAARLARLNPRLNAIVATDLDGARARAREADRARARGERWGPLHGLPMTVKDSIEVAGMPAVAGAPALRGHRPSRNAPAVQRLLDAGAIVFGKTNVPIYASDIQTFNAVHGATNNPWDVERTPGGSSGGAAAALAAGLAALELGSDVAGSIRIPAHFCGVYGHRPTFGLVPARGHLSGPPGSPDEPDMLVLGPLARSVEDLRLGLSVLAGPEVTALRLALPPPGPARLGEYRVRVWLDDGACPLGTEVRAVLEAAVARIRAAGCTVREGPPPGVALGQIHEEYATLLAAAMSSYLPERVFRRARVSGTLAHWLRRDRAGTLPGFLRRLTLPHREWLHAHARRLELQRRFEAAFAETDVLLTPVTHTAALPHHQAGSPYERTIRVDGRAQPYASQFVWISPASLLGVPATAVPAGRTPGGFPVGLQVLAPRYRDLATLDFARRLEEVLGGFVPPPGAA